MKNNLGEKIKEMARSLKYGTITIEFTCSRGVVVKAVVKDTKKVILLNLSK